MKEKNLFSSTMALTSAEITLGRLGADGRHEHALQELRSHLNITPGFGEDKSEGREHSY